MAATVIQVVVAPTTALTDVIATPIPADTTAEETTAATIELVAVPWVLPRVNFSARTSVVAPIYRECNVRPANASAMRLLIAIC